MKEQPYTKGGYAVQNLRFETWDIYSADKASLVPQLVILGEIRLEYEFLPMIWDIYGKPKAFVLSDRVAKLFTENHERWDIKVKHEIGDWNE